jgi:hypothetical protein
VTDDQPDTTGRRDAVRRPWLPGCLAAHHLSPDTVSVLSYLVVEEIVEDVTVITVWPWPAADGHGRLRFDASTVREVAVPTEVLDDQLYRGWPGRSPHIGDVFAARVDERVLEEAAHDLWPGPLELLLPDGLYDLSAEARKVAKLALYAVRADVLDPAEAVAYDMTVTAVRDDRPAAHRSLRHVASSGEGS